MRRDKLVQEWSAGGIIFHGERVLVLSNHRGDAVFPKGHLEGEETPEQAALREVEEEAGIRPEIVSPLGTTEYEFYWPADRTRRHKTVHWYLMKAKDTAVKCDGYEIKSGRYISVSEALHLLTYDLDREKLNMAQEVWLRDRNIK